MIIYTNKIYRSFQSSISVEVTLIKNVLEFLQRFPSTVHPQLSQEN